MGERNKWDEMFIKGTYLKDLDDSHQSLHLQFKSPSFMVTNRDMCLARAVKRTDGIILSNHVSVETDLLNKLKDLLELKCMLVVFTSNKKLKVNLQLLM